MKNYYTILGIHKEATQEQIKIAYRKLLLKFHPDKNDNDEFLAEMIKNSNEANETLSNLEKRQAYDLYLTNSTLLKQHSEPSPEVHNSEQYPNISNLLAVYVDKIREAHFAAHQFELIEKISKPTNFSFSTVLFVSMIIGGCFWFLKPNFNFMYDKPFQNWLPIEQLFRNNQSAFESVSFVPDNAAV